MEVIVKKAVNLRLKENTVILLNTLSKELQTTKTSIVEQAIKQFSNQYLEKRKQLMTFAGKLDSREADLILGAITENKINKDFIPDI